MIYVEAIVEQDTCCRMMRALPKTAYLVEISSRYVARPQNLLWDNGGVGLHCIPEASLVPS